MAGAALFALNAVTLRGPTWRRELAISAAIPLGAALILLVLMLLDGAGWIPQAGVRYTLLLLVVWKIALCYWLFFLQQVPFSLYEYFNPDSGRTLPLGPIVVAAGAVFKPQLVDAFANPFWRAAVS